MRPPAPMSLRRLAWTLRSRGPDLSTWPTADRDAALALARTDAEARARLADALDDEAAPPPDPEAQGRLQRRVAQRLVPLGRGLRWGILALGLAAGLYVGVVPAEPDAADPGVTVQATTSAALFAALDP